VSGQFFSRGTSALFFFFSGYGNLRHRGNKFYRVRLVSFFSFPLPRPDFIFRRIRLFLSFSFPSLIWPTGPISRGVRTNPDDSRLFSPNPLRGNSKARCLLFFSPPEKGHAVDPELLHQLSPPSPSFFQETKVWGPSVFFSSAQLRRRGKPKDPLLLAPLSSSCRKLLNPFSFVA